MINQLADLQAYWTPIAPIFSINSEAEYDTAVERLNTLLDEVGTNERHPLYGLVDTLGTVIHTYELEYFRLPDATGPEVLRFLMQEHDVSETELPEIGSSNEVNRFLTGAMELSTGQVRALANRFHVSPAAFI